MNRRFKKATAEHKNLPMLLYKYFDHITFKLSNLFYNIFC